MCKRRFPRLDSARPPLRSPWSSASAYWTGQNSGSCYNATPAASAPSRRRPLSGPRPRRLRPADLACSQSIGTLPELPDEEDLVKRLVHNDQADRCPVDREPEFPAFRAVGDHALSHQILLVQPWAAVHAISHLHAWHPLRIFHYCIIVRSHRKRALERSFPVLGYLFPAFMEPGIRLCRNLFMLFTAPPFFCRSFLECFSAFFKVAAVFPASVAAVPSKL